jgi:hypothetical protein
LSEKMSPATYEASSTTATSADIVSRSPGKWWSRSVGLGSEPPTTSWKIAGMTSATDASMSISACAWAAVASKYWRSRPR